MSKSFFPRVTIPEMPRLSPKDYKLADTFYDRLRKHINETQKKLKKDEELAIYYYNQAGDSILVSDIGYYNPNLIILYGKDAQLNECSVLLHMESVQLILKILRIKNDAERKVIGFLK